MREERRVPKDPESRPTAARARRRVGRPTSRVLSRRLITETGLRLLDERGAEGAGMRAIAKELGVQPSALYNHVGGHAELLAGVRELLGERIPVDMFAELPWDAALADWARRYRSAFAAHPATIALLAVLPLAEDSALTGMYDTVAGALVRAGCPEDRAVSVIVALESFILGSALDLIAADDMLDPGPRADVPAFSAAYRARAERLAETGRRSADDAFEVGLRAMIAGFGAGFAPDAERSA